MVHRRRPHCMLQTFFGRRGMRASRSLIAFRGLFFIRSSIDVCPRVSSVLKIAFSQRRSTTVRTRAHAVAGAAAGEGRRRRATAGLRTNAVDECRNSNDAGSIACPAPATNRRPASDGSGGAVARRASALRRRTLQETGSRDTRSEAAAANEWPSPHCPFEHAFFIGSLI